MKRVAAILAAGKAERFGADKLEAILGDRPVWRWSYDAYAVHPAIDAVILVTSEAKCDGMQDLLGLGVKVVPGGSTRQESSYAALEAADGADVLLVHDAARPFVSQALISRTIEAIEKHGAAGAGLAVTDTIKQVESGGVRTLDRSKLIAMQTPQGARTDLLRQAHMQAPAGATDEMAMIEALGVHPEIVEGEPTNFKITTPEDLSRARSMVGSGETRSGLGYDVHAFSDDQDRPLYLGGIHFPGHRALAGHSDADVLLHAATDALLGAAALGDIGCHFPPSDQRWKNESSLTFLRHAGNLLREGGWQVVNLDIAVIAESPKIMPRAMEIRSAIAEALGIDASRVSVKATTNEGLGSIGRSEGIAAFATANIRR